MFSGNVCQCVLQLQTPDIANIYWPFVVVAALYAAIVSIIPPGCVSDGFELPAGVEVEETETGTIISRRLYKIVCNFMFVFLANSNNNKKRKNESTSATSVSYTAC